MALEIDLNAEAGARRPRLATATVMHNLLRRAAILAGFAVLAIFAYRSFGPGPDLEMAADSCARFDPEATTMVKLGRAAEQAFSGHYEGLESDWARLCKYRKANTRVMAGPPPRIVMIGDSITQFWEEENPELFGPGMVNRGIAGQTSTQVLVRFQQDAVALRPKIVHIMAGLNDIAGNTGQMAPQDYKNNFTAMIDIAQARGMTVVLGSITPARNFHWREGIDPSRRIVALNRWLADTAKARGLVYADYHRVLADGRGYPRPELDADGSHPNRTGFAAMKPVLQAALAEAEIKMGGS